MPRSAEGHDPPRVQVGPGQDHLKIGNGCAVMTVVSEFGSPLMPVPDVLVVDDESDVAALLVAYLRRWECTVRVAYTGEAAVALARQSPPDVAIVDILLPGIDGWETIKQIRSLPDNHRCKIVAMSTADAQAHPSSFNGCLRKPFAWDDMKRVIQPLLQGGAHT